MATKDKGRRSRTRSHRPKYKHIIHCGNIRQEALVCFMQEMPDSAIEEVEVNGMSIIAALAAAAVLGESTDDDLDCDGGINRVGCAVEIKFKFTLRPEWIQPGMRFIVRDQSGHISGAGVLSCVHAM